MRLMYWILFCISLNWTSQNLHGEDKTETKTEESCNISDTKEEDAKKSSSEDNKNTDSDEKKDKEKTKNEDKDKDKDKEKEKEEPPKIGNFKLRVSQLPAPLFSFGQNIIEKGQIQLFLFGDAFLGKEKTISDLIPGILFGVTDDFTLFFNFPVTPAMRDGPDHSSGIEDCFLQTEYAFYNHSTKDYVDQATVVFSIYVPTGSARRSPPTGFGAPAFFIGATYNHMLVDWFVFVSPGALLTTSYHHTQFGNQFLYEFGFGRNIPSPKDWIYAWMIEFEGQYNQKNIIKGAVDPNSGGNFIFINPSIFISNNDWMFQFGAGFPVLQNYFGQQRKFDYMLDFQIVRTY